ncbi:hypothetical protein QUW41_07735 [Slackia piriformis]|nr:hypothetical protein [Slackia piriformis]
MDSFCAKKGPGDFLFRMMLGMGAGEMWRRADGLLRHAAYQMGVELESFARMWGAEG